MASFDDVIATAGHWPGVTVGTWYGTPGLKVGGKGFCRVWGQREHDRDDVHDTKVLVVMCDPDEKLVLIGNSAGVLFSTPHYEGSGAMLIRLNDVDRGDLSGYLEDAYCRKATARLLKEFASAD